MDRFWHEVTTALAREFSDIADVGDAVTVLVRLLMAVLLTGLLGYERERRDAPAGLRTHMLVGLGAALFVIVPEQAGAPPQDMTRVVQGVVSGIGFLGAGAILKLDRAEQVHGLTTAASIWAAAAIGVAAGMGREWTAIVTTALALAILTVLLHWERRMGADK